MQRISYRLFFSSQTQKCHLSSLSPYLIIQSNFRTSQFRNHHATSRTSKTLIPAVHSTSKIVSYPLVKQTQRYCSNSNPKENVKQSENTKLLQRVWTIPNILSCGRMVLAPVVGYLVVTQQPVMAIVVLGICGISDVLDGWIARKFNQQSALGSALDPIGDKLIVASLSISLFLTGQLPGWLFGIIVCRDLMLVAFSLFIRYRTMTGPITLSRFVSPTVNTAVIHPTWISKLNTVLQFSLLGFTLADPIFTVFHPMLFPFQVLVGATTCASAADYFLNYKKSLHVVPKE